MLGLGKSLYSVTTFLSLSIERSQLITGNLSPAFRSRLLITKFFLEFNNSGLYESCLDPNSRCMQKPIGGR